MPTFPPSPPSNVYIGGRPKSDGMHLTQKDSVGIAADLFDANPNARVRLRVWWSTDSHLTHFKHERFSDPVHNGQKATVQIGGLHEGTHYYVRIWAQDVGSGKYSTAYSAGDFITGGAPATPPGGGGGGTGGGPPAEPDKPGQQAPGIAYDITINGKPEAAGMATKAKNQVKVGATVRDPDGDRVRILVRWSTDNNMAHAKEKFSRYAGSTQRAEVTLTGLAQDTHYYIRVYAQDDRGAWARVQGGPDEGERAFNSANFWTNRSPIATLVTPPENSHFPTSSEVTFDWKYKDPDPNDGQAGFEFRYRVAATALEPAGAWHVVSRPNSDRTNVKIVDDTFRGNTFYDWSIRVKDEQDRWGAWALPFGFYATADTSPPVLKAPVRDTAFNAHNQVTLKWKFRSPTPGASQIRADLRYRLVGDPPEAWTTTLGDERTGQTWTLPDDFFAPGYHYQWQIRTYDNLFNPPSPWSEPGTFWTTGTPGSQATPPDIDVSAIIEGTLGCGAYRVFIYEQGGQRRLGEIEPLTTLQFNRVRDDISSALLTSNGFSSDCGDLYSTIRSWMHEVVIFRDGKRVWEGPITRITYNAGGIELEAKDCMGYLYRRIMRQGYNDSYRVIDGEQVGLLTVTRRALQITMDALAPSDPNLLPYLTVYQFADDARQSRVIPDYSTTAWEQIDDLAATAGLDYTVVGRRIVYNDTHRAIGRLPVMQDGDFTDPPVVTEYGMQLCNYAAVTNGQGIWGDAHPRDEVERFEAYGPIEMLASAYGESAGGPAQTVTPAARQRMVDAMEAQARRNIAGRWPTPLVVRVPDNTTLNPDAGIGFNQLIPGVWIPLRSTNTLRKVTQWQKLDSITVTADSTASEKISIVMSPAPNGGTDPDSGSGDVAEGGGGL